MINSKLRKNEQGFTLIEILIVMALVAMLATIVIVAINPARQFAQARNTQRLSGVNAILNAVHQNSIDNKGNFNFAGCGATAMPSSAKTIKKPAGTDGVDLCGCLSTTYISILPVDPTNGTPEAGVTSCSGDYNTGYTIYQDATTGRTTIGAPSAELGQTISVTR